LIPFQYGGIFVSLLLALWGARRLWRRTRPAWVSTAAILVGTLGGIAIYDPELTTTIARAVGIARGADLLTYLIALAFLASWFYFYQKIRTLSNAVTALVRELAIRDPRLPPDSPPSSADKTPGS